MSNVDFITFTDLMRETNIDDPNELKKILRRRIDLPQISARKPISRHDADIIIKKLTTRKKVDWIKYKIQKKGEETDGPLVWSKSTEIKNAVTNWFLKIPPTSKIKSENFYIVGIACDGGFLQGEDNSNFVMGFQQGINVVIGERGSGKSTTLNLIGTISNSIGEDAQGLIQRLINLLYPDEKSTNNDIANLNVRVSKTLKYYGVDKYAVFVQSAEKFSCYYADRKLKHYSFLSLTNQGWAITEESNFIINPPILFLEQGEVIRIAEDRDGKYYLNSILDAIYPELFQKRAKIIPLFQDLLRQHTNYVPEYKSVRTEKARLFLNERYREFNKIQLDLENQDFDPESEKIIQSYLDYYINFVQSHSGQSLENKSIKDLLQEGDDALYYLYISKIGPFLSRRIKIIREFTRQENLKTTHISIDDSFEFIEKDSKTQSLVDLTQNIDEIDIDEFTSDAEDIPDDLDLEYEDSDLFVREFGSSDKDNLNLFLDAIDKMERPKISREFYNVLFEVVEYLRVRLRIIGRWIRIYGHELEAFSPSLDSLAQKYVDLLNYKIDVLKEQEVKCTLITALLNKDKLAVDISTSLLNENLEKLDSEIQVVSSLEAKYSQLMTASLNVKTADLFSIQDEYEGIVINLHDQLQRLSDQLENDSRDLMFYPLSIKYQQGDSSVDFQHLSFGQKSGIILKMVLLTTNKSSIIVDQPEDNLDAFSIVNLIAPALAKLSLSRQIIIVTHNFNLILKMGAQNLAVLKSSEEAGKVKIQGALFSQDVIRELFDVLEGGVQTFEQKIQTYEEFIGAISGPVPLIDIQSIESLFRKRTIDELRNFLQPVVSDNDRLAFLRHELSQPSLDQYLSDNDKLAFLRHELNQPNPDQYLEDIQDSIKKYIRPLAKVSLN